MQNLFIRKNYTLFIIALFIGCLFYSCKKIDITESPENQQIVKVEKDFFYASQNTNVLIKRVIENIKVINAKKEFVTNFARTNGFPIWDKAIIKIFKNNTESILNSNSASDTFAYIPLVLRDSSTVNGYILANINSTIKLSYSLAKDYKAYPLTSNSNQMTSDAFALKMMLLQQKVFGTVTFNLNDNGLFTQVKTDSGGHSNHRRIRLIPKDRVVTNELMVYVEVCSGIQWTCNICNSESCPLSGSLVTCETYQYQTGYGSGGSGGSVGGSGGGSIPYSYPCNPNLPAPFSNGGTTSNFGPDPLPPCQEPPPGTGWNPAPFNVDVISFPQSPEYPDISDGEPQVSLQSLFNCFAQIPDAGATYSVKLCADLPVNGFQNAPFNLTHKAPGHTFLTLTKSNGSQSISQTVGFYPIGSGGNPINPTATGGFKNNGLPIHEYNAAITASNINASQFWMVMNNLYSHENDTYNIFNNNCTTIALNAFNLLVTPDITIEPFVVQTPTNPPVYSFFMQSPQKLYKAIETFQPGFGVTKDYNVNYYSPYSTNVCP